MKLLQNLFNDPLVNAIAGPVLARMLGVDPRVIRTLYTEEEKRRADAMSIPEMAEEALMAKFQA